MAEPQIRYDDGAAYERMMGTWSRLAAMCSSTGWHRNRVCDGSTSVAATVPSRSCWSNAVPAEVQGIDPSEAQLEFARNRTAAPMVEFRQGNARHGPDALPSAKHRSIPDGRAAGPVDGRRTRSGRDAGDRRATDVRGFRGLLATNLLGTTVRSVIAAMAPDDAAMLKARMRERVAVIAEGPIVCDARANAIKGRVPR